MEQAEKNIIRDDDSEEPIMTDWWLMVFLALEIAMEKEKNQEIVRKINQAWWESFEKQFSEL